VQLFVNTHQGLLLLSECHSKVAGGLDLGQTPLSPMSGIADNGVTDSISEGFGNRGRLSEGEKYISITEEGGNQN
jgi:hypothetical protein